MAITAVPGQTPRSRWMRQGRAYGQGLMEQQGGHVTTGCRNLTS